jgi:hypothetical protein
MDHLMNIDYNFPVRHTIYFIVNWKQMSSDLSVEEIYFEFIRNTVNCFLA